MEMASRDAELRSALFRLVDVTPACRSTADLADHLAAYLEEVPERPPALDAALRAAHAPGGARALGRATAAGVRHMAHRFIAGETPKKALGRVPAPVGGRGGQLGRPARRGHRDQLRGRPLRRPLPRRAGHRRARPQPAGRPARRWSATRSARSPRANVSVKISALTPHMRPEAPARGPRRRRRRGCARCCAGPRSWGAYLHIDMESVDSLETTFALIFGVLGEDEFRDGPEAGLVLQAYLRESPRAAGAGPGLRPRAPGARTPLTVRLVKGAYWDHELVEAQPARLERCRCSRSRPTRTATSRRSPGGCSRRARAATACAWRWPRTTCARWRTPSPATASWGAPTATWSSRSCAAWATSSSTRCPPSGLRVRAYCPVGDLVAGMAYLVRRLLENTSNDSFLGDQQRGVPIGELLAAP